MAKPFIIRPYKGGKTGELEIHIRDRRPDGTVIEDRRKVQEQSPTRSEKVRLAEAERFAWERLQALRREHELGQGRGAKKPIPTLAAFSPQFLSFLKVEKTHSTHELWEGALRLHILPLLGDRALDEIRETDVALIKSKMKDKGRDDDSINVALKALSRLLRYAIELKIIAAMPCRFRFLKESHKDPEYYRPEERERLYTAAGALAPERHYLMALIGAEAGLRRGEFMGLKVEDLDFEQREIKVRRQLVEFWIKGKPREYREAPPKGKKPRPASMSERLYEALQAYAPRSRGYVLRQEDGSPLTNDTARRWLEEAQRAAGLDVAGRTHILRHSYAAEQVRRGISMRQLQVLLGHGSVQTTIKYYAHLAVGEAADTFHRLDRAETERRRAEAVTESGSKSREFHHNGSILGGEPADLVEQFDVPAQDADFLIPALLRNVSAEVGAVPPSPPESPPIAPTLETGWRRSPRYGEGLLWKGADRLWLASLLEEGGAL